MNSPENNTLEVIRNDMRILDAKIELAEKYHDEIDKIYQAIADEMASLRAQKKSLEETAKSIIEK